MCGIVGLLKRNGDHWDGPPKELRAMLATIAHRGPDSSDIFVDGPIALGVNRLAIIDPGPQSDQPITSPDGRHTIAFNGEIYNYRALRRQIQQSGYRFSTGSDTEVLLALYALQQEKCLDKLRGMFACAIWDRQERSLFLARDRIGEKPLAYYADDNIFIFASELPALLASPRVPRRINSAGILSAMNFMHAIAPKSPFADIYKLQPAHFMKVSADKIRIQRYWQCSFDKVAQFTDEQECIEEIVRCFDDTVTLMSSCDAPVGALLSGGLDSSSVVASMSRVLHNFPTFRISTHNGPGSQQEMKSARAVAQRYNTEHFEYVLSARNLHHLKDVVRHHGEPVASPVPVDAYLVSREMQKQVKVALCGAGGDELFGGYQEHQILHILDTFPPQSLIGEKASLLSPEEKFASEIYQKFGPIKREQLFASMKYHDFSLRQKIFSKKMREDCTANPPQRNCAEDYLSCHADNLFNGFFNQQISRISQYSMAEINDRMGMAHSVEIRSPFLDIAMLELAMKIPPRFKVAPTLKDGICKRILRRAMADRLPHSTLKVEKIGFGGTVPIGKWIQEDCSDFIEEKLQSKQLADCGLFDPKGIQELYTLYQCGAALDRDLFIGLVSTAIWLEEFF